MKLFKLFIKVELFLLFILSFASIAFAQDMNPSAAELYNQGNKYLRDGEYQNAIDDYNKALNFQEDFRIYYQRGVAFIKNGN